MENIGTLWNTNQDHKSHKENVSGLWWTSPLKGEAKFFLSNFDWCETRLPTLTLFIFIDN